MTKKTEDKATKEANKEREAQAKRIQPDKPEGLTHQTEQDPYKGERDEDGFTPAQVNQRQQSQPGALDQKGPNGETIGEEEDAGNPVGGKRL